MPDTVGFYASSAPARNLPDHPNYTEFVRRQSEARTAGTASLSPIPCRYCGQASAGRIQYGGFCCEARQFDGERLQLPDAVSLLRRHGYTVTPPESTP